MSKVGGFTFNLCWIWKKITHSSIISLMKKDFIVQRDEFWAGLWTDFEIEQTMICSFKSLGGLQEGKGWMNRQGIYGYQLYTIVLQ